MKLAEIIKGTTPPFRPDAIWMDTSNPYSPRLKSYYDKMWRPLFDSSGGFDPANYYDKNQSDLRFLQILDCPIEKSTGSNSAVIKNSDNVAIGNGAFAHGYNNSANGNYSHAEGYKTTANSSYSHVSGYHTIVNNSFEFAIGHYNISNHVSGSSFGNPNNTLFSIGIGTNLQRKNGFEIMENGDVYINNIGGYNGTNPISGMNDICTVFNSKISKPNVFTSRNFVAFDSNGNIIDSGHSNSDYLTQHQDISGKADKSEMSVVDGTGVNSDKTTITLKSGTSATVLKSHQDISGKAEKSEMSITNGTGVNADKTTIQLKNGLSTTVLISHQDVSNKYEKPSTGIPKSDLSQSVQDSLDLADSAIQNLNDVPVKNGLGSNQVLQKNTNTEASNDCEVAFGEYNKSNTGATDSEKTEFSIGIGDSNTRKNSLELMKDGSVYVFGVGGYDGTNPSQSIDLANALIGIATGCVKKPVVIWETNGVGLVGLNTDMSASPSWQLTDLDMTPYKYIKVYSRSAQKSGVTASASTTAAMVLEISLDSRAAGPYGGHYIGSVVSQKPNDANRFATLTCAVSSDKTSFAVIRMTSLYGTAATSNSDVDAYVFKIVGYYD